MDTQLKVWSCVVPFLIPPERVLLSCTSSHHHDALKSTLNRQFDYLLKYQTWRSAKLHESGVRTAKKQAKIPSPIVRIAEEKSWFPELVYQLEYEAIDSEEQGKSLFRNQFGDVLVVPAAVVTEVSEDSGESSSFTALADTSIGTDQIDFTSQSDLLKRQRVLLEHLQMTKEKERSWKQEQLLRAYRGSGVWGVVLCHGGYFAIGCYDRSGKCLFHQSDHRYVSRKKQGGRQAAKDKHQGSNIHSAGSSLRREMEKKHQEAILSILTAQKSHLEACDIIFLHAPGINRGFFLGQGSPLEQLQGKVRSVGMSAGKANYTEVQRIMQELSGVELRIVRET